jgi:hypothetical protein
VTEDTIDPDGEGEFPLEAEVAAEVPATEDEFDQELGRRMGRDAQRVADGELTQQEFYDKYHEEVLEEFGEDKRPGGDER